MDTFRAFKHKNFKLFFYGQSISLIGTWIQKTAVVWLVYRLTGSALLLGVVTFVSLIPTLLLSPYAGSFIDRKDGFKIMKNTQKAALIQAGLRAVVVYSGYENVWAIIILSAVQGIINAFDVICRQSLMVEMVDDKADLPNAIAMNSTISNLARVAGPAVAGIILTTFGEDFCFISNFLSYIPVLYCLYLMKLKVKQSASPVSDPLADLKAGFKYITSEKDMIGLILLLSASSLLLAPFTTLMPVFAKDVFKGTAGTFSLFESAIGVGSVISAIYMAQLKAVDKLLGITVVSTLLFSIGTLLIGISGNISLAILGMIMGGCGMMAQSSAINTYIQTHALPEMRSRAISYYIMAFLGVSPIGSLLIGLLTTWMPPHVVLTVEGLLGLIVVAVYLVYRKRLKAKEHFDQNDGQLLLSHS